MLQQIFQKNIWTPLYFPDDNQIPFLLLLILLRTDD